MNMLASLKQDENVKIEAEKDSVGGGARVLDSDLYKFRIGMAYTKKSGSGALGLFLTLVDLADNKSETRMTLWMTGGDAKGNKTYYTKDDVNYPLPGFSHANSIALLTTGKEIGDLDTEDKVIKLYDFDAKAEVPTTVAAVVALIGQEVNLGILRQTVDKTKETAPKSGIYVPTGETRDQNEIDKVFCAKEAHLNMTLTEIKAKAEVAVFADTWLEKNKGITQNKAKGAAAGGTAGAPGAAAGTAGTPKPKTSLFGA